MQRQFLIAAMLTLVLVTFGPASARAEHGGGTLPSVEPAAGQIMPHDLGPGVPLRSSYDPDEKVLGRKIIEHGVYREELTPIDEPESAPVGNRDEVKTIYVPDQNIELQRSTTKSLQIRDSDIIEIPPLLIPKNIAPRKMAYPFKNEDWK